MAYLCGATPNQVSALSGAVTFAGIAGIALFRPSWPVATATVVVLLIGYGLDSADGQLARLQGSGSAAGEWLDHVLDSAKVAAFHLAILISWFRWYHLHHPAMFLIPLGFTLVSSVFFFTLILSDMLRRIARVQHGGSAITTAALDPNEAAPVLRSLIVLPNDYGFLCLALVLLPLHAAFIAVYTVFLAANVAYLAAGSARWFREMRALAK